MQQWEYLRIATQPTGNFGGSVCSINEKRPEGQLPDLGAYLVELGTQGWELLTVIVGISNTHMWIFKRAKQ